MHGAYFEERGLIPDGHFHEMGGGQIKIRRPVAVRVLHFEFDELRLVHEVGLGVARKRERIDSGINVDDRRQTLFDDDRAAIQEVRRNDRGLVGVRAAAICRWLTK